jgi:hypothetical protein
VPCQLFTQGQYVVEVKRARHRYSAQRPDVAKVLEPLNLSSGEDSKTFGAGDEAFRPHDVAMMTVACGISMKFGLKSRLPAASKVELLLRPPRIPCPTRHRACCCSLDYTNYSSLPKHILFFFPSTKLIKHSTKTTPNTPHQHFTMATLSCTYNLSPLARADHALESYVFVVICSQPHHLESIAAAPHSSPGHH